MTLDTGAVRPDGLWGSVERPEAPTKAVEFRVVALVAAFNEADIIEPVVSGLIDQGAMVYLLDDGSTDGTADIIERYRGKGVIDIERLTPPHAHSTRRFEWSAILQRKQALASELDAHWFIHHDADEFRESPWAHLNLAEAISKVDSLGYNAIDFKVFNFWPTHDGFRRGDDPRIAFSHYALGEEFNRAQIRCWKKTSPVDLTSTGGHAALFSEQRIFPIRFLLRHYPIRSQEHGERKVFSERQPCFLESERDRGWHVQYDTIHRGDSFIRNPASMMRFDPESARLQLLLEHRELEDLRDELQHLRGELSSASSALLSADVEIRRQSARAATLAFELEQALHSNRLLSDELSHANRYTNALLSSASWRWTSVLRAARRIAMGLWR